MIDMKENINIVKLAFRYQDNLKNEKVNEIVKKCYANIIKKQLDINKKIPSKEKRLVKILVEDID